MNRLIIGTVFLMLAFTGCSMEQFSSEYQSQPPTIDGNLEDWQTENSYMTEFNSAELQFMNDDNFLYIAVRTNELPLLMMLQRMGFTAWFTPGGGRNKHLEIHIPSSSAATFDQSRGGFWYHYTDEQREVALQRLSRLRKGVFVSNNQTGSWHIYPEASDAAFESVADYSSKSLSLEIKLPLQYQDDIVDISIPDDERKIGLGIVLPQIPGRDGSRSTMSNQGMGGGSLGGSGSRRLMEPREIWLEVTLANQ